MRGQINVLFLVVALIATAAVVANPSTLNFANTVINTNKHTTASTLHTVTYSTAPINKNVTFRFIVPSYPPSGSGYLDIIMYTSDNGNDWKLYKDMHVVKGTNEFNLPVYGKYVKFIIGKIDREISNDLYTSFPSTLFNQQYLGSVYQHSMDVVTKLKSVIIPELHVNVDGHVSNLLTASSGFSIGSFTNQGQTKNIGILLHKKLPSDGNIHVFEKPVVCLFYDNYTASDVSLQGSGIKEIETPAWISYFYAQHIPTSDIAKCYSLPDNFWDTWYNMSVTAGSVSTTSGEITMAVIDAGQEINPETGNITTEHFYNDDGVYHPLGNVEGIGSEMFVLNYQVSLK